MSVVGNSKLVFEKRFNDVYTNFEKEFNENNKNNIEKTLTILENLLEKNNEYIKQIKNEKNSLDNFENILSQKEKLFKKMEKEIIKNTNLNMEKDTFIMMSKEKNKNIEIYYVVYILFSVLLILIEGSIVLFK